MVENDRMRIQNAPVLLAPFLVVAVASSSPARAPTQERSAIELPSIVWSAGDVVHDEVHSRSTLRTVVFDQGVLIDEFDSIEERHASKSIRVLAVDDDLPTKLRVEYGTLKSVQRRVDAPDGGAATDDIDEIDERNPLEHKVFVVEKRGSRFLVLDEAGGRVAEGLARLVLEEEGLRDGTWLGPNDRVARELAGKVLPLGTEVTLSKDAAAACFEPREGLSNATLVVTPRANTSEGDRVVHVFGARLSVTEAGGLGRPETSIELSGDLRFDGATGRFLDLRLDGTLVLDSRAEDATRAIEVSGQGPWTIRRSSRHERAR